MSDGKRGREITSELGETGCRHYVALLLSFLTLINQVHRPLLSRRRSLLHSLRRVLGRVYHRRGCRCDTTRTDEAPERLLPQREVQLCEAWSIEEGKQKTRKCKGQWKEKDALRRAGHMAASSATRRLRLRLVRDAPLALHHPSVWIFHMGHHTTQSQLQTRHYLRTSLYSVTHLGHPHLRHDKHPLPRCRSWNTMAVWWS
jgi:hypothetical protein